MKLRFESDLDFQLEAVDAVCDLFRGQEVCRTEFTVTFASPSCRKQLAFGESDLGVGNRLTLLDEQILENLNDVQLRNGLSPSASLGSGDFTVEMEAGTARLMSICARSSNSTSAMVLPSSSLSFHQSRSRREFTSRCR